MFYSHVIKSSNTGSIFMIMCEITEIQMPFSPRLFILVDDSVLVGEDQRIKNCPNPYYDWQPNYQRMEDGGGSFPSRVGCGDGTSHNI